MIVGTAGHIDHGKTALLYALTGVDADRLKEEKARGITIDLGFAYWSLGDGNILGFVDVPGHEKFIRNMLAGATGIDFVMLVVAADDGVMPQTREHLDIVDLLGLSRGLVALTKCDLVPQERWAAVTAQVKSLLKGTLLEEAPVFPVSAVTSQGVDALRAELAEQAKSFVPKDTEGLFRLPVDRCFSLKGAGTIVTGAVVSGRVRVGDRVMISPKGLEARVRAIHAQNRPVEAGQVGERCALNLTGEGVGVHAIERGDFILAQGAHAPTRAVDCELRLLATEPKPLAHWTPVRLHYGAGSVGARLALLQHQDIRPGTTGRVQLVLDEPIAASVGDRFIIRDPSGARTMGGGRLIDLRGPRQRRRTPQRLARLDALALKDPAACLKALLDGPPFNENIAGFARDRAMSAAQVDALLARVPYVSAGNGDDRLVFSEMTWRSLVASAVSALTEFHRDYPQLLGPGIARLAKELEPRQKAKTGAAVIRELVSGGTLVSESGAIRLPGHRLALDGKDYRLWQRILPHLSGENRFRPPLGRECAPLLNAREFDVRRVLKNMARQERVIETGRDRFFLHETLQEIATILSGIAETAEDGWFPAAALRDRLANGRKVSIEILEYFDRNGLTFRRGDLRRVVPHRIEEYTRSADVRSQSIGRLTVDRV